MPGHFSLTSLILVHQDVLKKMIGQFAKMANKEGRVTKEVFKQTIATYYGGSDGTLVRMIMTLFDRDNRYDNPVSYH